MGSETGAQLDGIGRGVRLVGGVLFYSAAWLDDGLMQSSAAVKALPTPRTRAGEPER